MSSVLLATAVLIAGVGTCAASFLGPPLARLHFTGLSGPLPALLLAAAAALEGRSISMVLRLVLVAALLAASSGVVPHALARAHLVRSGHDGLRDR
jgi:hypothetical protein